MTIQYQFNGYQKIKITLFSNAAWKQRVRLQVPERRSATMQGPGPNLPSEDITFEGAGEGDLNFGKYVIDTGADGATFTIEFTHSSDNGSTWYESRIDVMDSLTITIFLTEDSSDNDFNDTIMKCQKKPYFT